MLFLSLFLTFFQIGLFGFGGGLAMISLMQGEVVSHYHWLTMSEFTDIFAISQMTPGPIGINMATYVGYKSVVHAGYAPWVGMLGSATATFAVMLPSFILMLFVTKFLLKYHNHPIVITTFSTIRIFAVGLLLAAFLLLLTPENFNFVSTSNLSPLTSNPSPLTSNPSPLTSNLSPLTSIIIFLATFFAVFRYKVSPIYCLLASALIGYLLL